MIRTDKYKIHQRVSVSKFLGKYTPTHPDPSAQVWTEFMCDETDIEMGTFQEGNKRGICFRYMGTQHPIQLLCEAQILPDTDRLFIHHQVQHSRLVHLNSCKLNFLVRGDVTLSK